MRDLLLSFVVGWTAFACPSVLAESVRRAPAARFHSVFHTTAPKSSDFYREFVSREDTAISWIYMEQWRTHDRHKRHEFSNGRAPVYSFVHNAANLREGDQRGLLASYVMRMRLEGMLVSYLTRKDATGSSKRLGKAYSAVRSGVEISEEAKFSLQMNYDFYQDFTRFSLRRSAFDASVLHLNTLNAALGAAAMDQISFQLGMRVGTNMRAYVQYETSSAVLESGLQRSFGGNIGGLIRVRGPMGDGSPSIDAALSLRF